MSRLAAGAAPANPPADLAALHAQAFPMLPSAMIERAAAYGDVVSAEPGRVLLNSGDREAAFYILLHGYIEVLEAQAGGVLRSLLVHRDGEFTGSLDLFTDRPNSVTVRASTPSRLLRLSRAALESLILEDRPMAEIILRAFMLRRIGYLRQRPYGGEILRSTARAGQEDPVMDLAVIGGGPAGLAAAAYAASEGLQTLLVGGSLSCGDAAGLDILNGFPGTITGLCDGPLLRRAEDQSRRFGAHLLPLRTVSRFDGGCYPYRVWLDDGQMIEARSLIVATGTQAGDGAEMSVQANTAWLDGWLDTDDQGYIHTGMAAAGSMQARDYESSQPGVFAVGAARAGSVKHVLASIAEGAAAVRIVHRFLDASAH